MKNRWFLGRVGCVFAVVMFFSVSPCHAKTDLDIIGSAGVAYDDNVTLAETDPEEDVVNNLRAGLGLKHIGKTHSLALEGGITQQLYSDNDDFNNLSQDLKLEANKDLTEYDRFKITESFIHAEEPTSFEDAFGRTAGRYSSYKNRLSVVREHDFSKQYSGELHYHNALNFYSRDDINDSVLHRFGGGTTYTHSSKTSFQGVYDLTYHHFLKQPDVIINSLTPGLRYYLTPQLFADFKAGVDLIDSFDDRFYARPLFSFELANQADENTELSLKFDQRHITSASRLDLFDSWRTSLRFNRKMSERTEAFLNGFYGEGEYINLDIKEVLQGVGTGITYALNRSLKATLQYSYTNSDSDDNSDDYHRNYSSLALALIF